MIELQPHSLDWAADFAREAARLHATFDAEAVALHHIGSTAVPGLLAKPIVDLMAAVPDLGRFDADGPDLRRLGYVAMGEYGIPGRRFFRKHDSRGRRSHHLHVYAAGSAHVARHLALRDYLRTHPEAREAYAAAKLAARANAGAHPGGYQAAKSAFVASLEATALAWARAAAPR